MRQYQNQKPTIRNVVYLSANSSYSHSSTAYGQLRCLAEKYAPEYKWDIVECTINDNPNETFLKTIKKKPHILISTVYLFNRNFILDIITKFALLSPDTIITLGGPEFLGNNKEILKQYPQISAVFRGDESSFPNYLNLLANKDCKDQALKQIPGICFVTKDKQYFDGGKALFVEPLDNLPSPYKAGYFNKGKPFVQLETSRGCPFKCSFCTSSLSQEVQYYSLQRVRSDLIHIEQAGIKEIRILDRTFNFPPSRAAKLLEMFSKEFADIKFHLEFHPADITNEITKQFSKAPVGQFHVEVGIQTFSRSSSAEINRKTIAGTRNNCPISELADIPGLKLHTDLIYGLPGQTKLTVFDDLRKLVLIGPEEIQLESLKILPGTPISTNVSLYAPVSNKSKINNALNSNPQSEIQNPKFFHSPAPPYDVFTTRNMSLNDIVCFSYLSKIIDTYYNEKTTKSLFRFAVINDNRFLVTFLRFAASHFAGNTEKPSLSKRFRLFFDFASNYLTVAPDNKYTHEPGGKCTPHIPANLTAKNPLYSITLFSYFAAGFFQSPIDNVRLIKKDELKAILTKKHSVLWSDNKATLEKPAYLASFDVNAGDIWLNPNTKTQKGNHNYIFLLSLGGMSKKISKIIHLDR